jgi:energy-coupling factor transport system ATP-binding protein
MATVPALKDVSFSLLPGEVMLVAGPSGGGKSTLIRLLNGLAYHHYHGQVLGSLMVLGKEHSSKTLSEISWQVASVFQNPESQFFGLNPRDEILLAWECRGLAKDKALALLEKWQETLKLSEFLLRPIASLSSGQKQKTILAESLALSPGLLILDEPSANLDPESTKDLASELKSLKETGISILIVDHHRRWLGDWVDKGLVLDKGRLMYFGPYAGLDDPVLREKYGLRPGHRGSNKPHSQASKKERKEENTVEAQKISFSYPKGSLLFKDLNLTLYPGEVTALTGQNGSGKTTLLKLLSGLIDPDSGSILFSGKALKKGQRLKNTSVAMQNADRQLVMSTVAQEIKAAYEKLCPKEIQRELERWNLGDLTQRHPQSLSGGERQRLALAAALSKKSQLLLLDEPTSGLDATNLALVAKAIKGASLTRPVYLITHDLDLLEMTGASIVALDELKAQNNTLAPQS